MGDDDQILSVQNIRRRFLRPWNALLDLPVRTEERSQFFQRERVNISVRRCALRLPWDPDIARFASRHERQTEPAGEPITERRELCSSKIPYGQNELSIRF